MLCPMALNAVRRTILNNCETVTLRHKQRCKTFSPNRISGLFYTSCKQAQNHLYKIIQMGHGLHTSNLLESDFMGTVISHSSNKSRKNCGEQETLTNGVSLIEEIILYSTAKPTLSILHIKNQHRP